MPFDALSTADNFRIQGSLTVINDPNGNSGNVNITGTTTVSGTASFASNANFTGPVSVSGSASFASNANFTGPVSVSGTLTAGSISAGGLNSSFTSGLTITGNVIYDVHVGGTPSVSTSSQSVSTSGASITMTSGVASGQNVIFVSANSTTATCVLTPTASASTSGGFQNGAEITMINLAAAGSNVLLPSTSMGSLGVYNYTLSAGHGVTFKYISALQTWIPLASA